MLRLGFLPHGVTGPLSRTPYLTNKQKSKPPTTQKTPRTRRPYPTCPSPRTRPRPRRAAEVPEKLSMAARHATTKKHAQSHASAPRKDKSQSLDQVVGVGGGGQADAGQRRGGPCDDGRRRIASPRPECSSSGVTEPIEECGRAGFYST